MSSLSRSIRLTNYSLKKGLLITLIVTLIIDIALIAANFYFESISIGGIITGSGDNQLLSIFAINILPFIIFFLTNSMLIFSESLPISISYSLTRGNFFKSMIINSAIIAAIFSIIQGILFKIEPALIGRMGKTARDNFIIFNTWNDNVFVIILCLFVMIISFLAFINLLVGLNYKFGFRVWLIVAGLILIGVLLNKGLNVSFAPFLSYVNMLMSIKMRFTNLIIMGVIFLVSNIINYLIIKSISIKYEIIKK